MTYSGAVVTKIADTEEKLTLPPEKKKEQKAPIRVTETETLDPSMLLKDSEIAGQLEKFNWSSLQRSLIKSAL